jgi:chromatin remodeling complex protein RSC6
MEVDLNDFRRRNPGRSGRRAAPPPLKKKSERKPKGEETLKKSQIYLNLLFSDPNRPKRPAKQYVLSHPLAEFMGKPKAGRTECSQKIMAYVKENKLQGNFFLFFCSFFFNCFLSWQILKMEESSIWRPMKS